MDNKTMKLSILIPSYNMSTKIDQCLESIFGSTASKDDYEVVVLDSSDDGSIDIYKKWIDKENTLKVARSKKRIDVGIARNLVVQQAKGDYIFYLDVDDKLNDKDVLKKMIDGLDGKDIYICSYKSRKDDHVFKLEPKTFLQAASCPVAPWTKVYKRELFVTFPKYTPEDVLPHYLLIDHCKTFGYFDFAVVDYDNTPENTGAISRTFDWLYTHPSNLMQLAVTDQIEKLGLKEEFVAGVIHNLADMWQFRNKLKNEEVKKAYMHRLCNEYKNFMSGIYVH